MISLIHPSRGRAKKAHDTFRYWMDNSSGTIKIQHILSIDNDDNHRQEYFNLFTKSLIVSGNNDCVVMATNEAAKHTTGEILIYLSDDFKCPHDWDLALVNKFAATSDPALVKVDDCLQLYKADVLTIPVMNKVLYNRLGTFWHPGYKSMFVDQDLFWVCTNNNWLIPAPELKFPHEHYCNGKAEKDETYKRSDANWHHGKAFYEKRKMEGFVI